MSSIKEKTYSVVSKQFSLSVGEVSDETSPIEVASWDSIGQLRLTLELEKQFNVKLSIDDLMSMNNVGDIVTVLSKHLHEGQGENENDSITGASPALHPIRVPRKTYWGRESLSALSEIDFDRVAIIAGSSEYANNVVRRISSIISDDTEMSVFNKPAGEPKESDILDLSHQITKFSPTQILAVGGGSTMDIAKMVWLLYENTGFDLAQLSGSVSELTLRQKSGFIAIPTLFGSGSEVSSAAAFTRKGTFNKAIVVHDELVPDLVVLDSRLANSVSTDGWFSGAFDALTHCIEGYASIVNNSMLKPIALTMIGNILKTIDNALRNGITDDVNEFLCYQAYYAGLIQNHCSVGLVHSFAHQLESFGLPHGVANALFLLPVMEYNSEKIEKYDIMARDTGFESKQAFFEKIKELINKSGVLPGQTKINEIKKSKAKIIAGAMGDITFRTNPVALDESQVGIVFDNTMRDITHE